jgi:hypothetical protein
VRDETQQGESHGYSQFFRNGFFEGTMVLSRRGEENRAILPSVLYEQQLITLLGSFRGALERLGINYECAVMVSLLRADEVKLGVRADWGFDEPHQALFDRKIIVLPDVVALADTTPALALKPVFDLMWQAAGFAGSRNYNAAGAWAPS